MTLEELEKRCDEVEKFCSTHGISDAAFDVQLPRKIKGERCRLAPGLYGKVYFYGDKYIPSIVSLKCADVRKWIARVREVE